MWPPEHHKWRATDMSDKLDIEQAATRAPHATGNRYDKGERQASGVLEDLVLYARWQARSSIQGQQML
ncbi:hypothetical protein RRG08_059863 [Elysia crispata]|uniref:Uncharacterized protein n=1 Tax=Elysia crispata TaxID=231223 RepID=A0AAE1D246_9GAST|nr:hypothetical protein RRG08_059863 [Elysia crispata]